MIMETKREWTVHDTITNGNKGYEIHYSKGGECITDHVYELADAKLIAAAPDLLEALLLIKKSLSNGDITMYEETSIDHMDIIEKAIKKATE